MNIIKAASSQQRRVGKKRGRPKQNITATKIKPLHIDMSRLSEEDRQIIENIVKKSNAEKIGGAEKAKLTEDRFRKVLNENRSSQDYDFASGPNTFFGLDRVELKQFTGHNNWKAQQVKPHLYDKVIMIREEKDGIYVFVIKTSLISSKVSTRENPYKEEGKMKLSGQHKGNENEGMLNMDIATKKYILGKVDKIIPANNDEWSDLVTFIGKYPPMNYSREDLGLEDQDILSILTFVKNY